MKIYFGGAIAAGRDDHGLYAELITHLKKYGTVLTEHVGNPQLASSGEFELSKQYIHDRDMAWLDEADVVVAEVTIPSLGVGYELRRTAETKKRNLCLYRPKDLKRLSAMIEGCKDLNVKPYETIDEAKKMIDDFMEPSSPKNL